MYGLASIFSWNAIILSSYYFTQRLENWKTNIYVSDWLLMAFSLIRIAYLFSSPLILRLLNHFTMIHSSQAGLCLCFLSFALLSLLGESLSNEIFFTLIVTLVILSSIFSGIVYQSGLAVLTAVPAIYTQATSMGQGTTGIIASIMKLVSIIMSKGESNIGYDSMIYFWMTFSFSLLAFVLFIPVKKMIDFWPENFQEKDQVNIQKEPLVKSYISAYQKIKKDAIFMFITMLQYMFIAPTFVNMTRSTKFQDNEIDSIYSPKIFSIFLLLIMAIGDFLGRMILRFKVTQIQHAALHPILIIIRCIMIPIILLGNLYFQGNNDTYPLSRPFANDISSLIILTLLSFTGGYAVTHLFMFGPRKVEMYQREKASFVMVFFRVMGMFLGAVFAFLYKLLLREIIHNS